MTAKCDATCEDVRDTRSEVHGFLPSGGQFLRGELQIMIRRRSRPHLILAFLLLLSAVVSPLSARHTSAQRTPEPVDLASIFLTTEDLEDIGYEDYALWSGTPYSLEDDVTYMVDSQNLDADEVEEVFTEAGHLGSFVSIHMIPADPDDPNGPPIREIYTTAYLFEDEEGAEAAYEIITDESQTQSGADIDNVGQGLGDDSEMTTIMWEQDAVFGLPNTQIELEILFDRIVLDVSTYNYDPEQVGMPIFEPDEMSNLEAAGGRLIERAEDALDGRGPNLGLLALWLDSDSGELPYVTYQYLDESPTQGIFEDEESYEERIGLHAEREITNLYQHQQLLTSPTDEAGAFRFYMGLLKFDSKAAAETYFANTEDRLGENERYADVEMVDVDQVGDESEAVSLLIEFEGGDWTLNEYFVRVGDIVAVFYFQQDGAEESGPEVSIDTLSEVGEYQAECLEAGSCEDPLRMPDEIDEVVEDLGTSLLGPRD